VLEVQPVIFGIWYFWLFSALTQTQNHFATRLLSCR